MKTSTAINAHKTLLIPIVVAMMAYYDNWSAEAFIYLALHGSYCLLWLMKHAWFPDRRFAERHPWPIAVLFIFLPLAGYYVAPFLLISRHVALPPAIIGLAIFLFTIGVFFHFVADAQKSFTLRLKPGLIEDGLFARTRNPNYFGEILIYLAYAILSWHWLPFVILAAWIFGFFLRNMLAKDRSLARHPGFAAYRLRSGLLFPKLLR